MPVSALPLRPLPGPHASQYATRGDTATTAHLPGQALPDALTELPPQSLWAGITDEAGDPLAVHPEFAPAHPHRRGHHSGRSHDGPPGS